MYSVYAQPNLDVYFCIPRKLNYFKQHNSLRISYLHVCVHVQAVNDVLVGVTSAALSRYYYRKSGIGKRYHIFLTLFEILAHVLFPVVGDKETTKEIRLRSILPVNLRPTTSLQVRIRKRQKQNRSYLAYIDG